jgi:outer membrane protein assembly factor BamB
MKPLTAGIVSFGLTSLLGAAGVGFWLSRPTPYELTRRVPGTDRAAGLTGQDVPETIEGRVETFDVKAPDLRGSWSGFRGPTREGISDEMTELARGWPESGPPVLWSLDVAQGHAGAAIRKGRVYLHDYDANSRGEVIRCLSLADGRDIWRHSYRLRIKRNHGVSRTVPAVTDKYVVTFGPKCHVTCLDANSGQRRWAIGMVRQFGTRIPSWYAGQCPLIDDGNAILAPCGKVTQYVGADGQLVSRGESVLMMAVECETGKVLWKTPNPDRWRMTHSSIAAVELEDYTRMYVYCGSGGVVGVSAADGKVLWKTDQWKIGIANVPTPVPLGGDRILLTGGYGAGSMIIQIVKEADAYVPKVLVRLPPSKFASMQQTPVFYKSHIFATRPDQQFVCMSTRGEIVWASGRENKFGMEGGPFLVADDMILLMDDDGVLTLLKATPESFQQLARAKVLPGHHSWGPMALADGRLIVRDLTHMVCLDVSKKP